MPPPKRNEEVDEPDEESGMVSRFKQLQEKLTEAERRANEAEELKERAVVDLSRQMKDLKEENSRLRQTAPSYVDSPQAPNPPMAMPVSPQSPYAPTPAFDAMAPQGSSLPPYKVRWYETQRSASGASMRVPKYSEEVWDSPPQKDDERLVNFALARGPGSYDIVDRNRRLISNVTYEGTPAPAQPQAVAPVAPAAGPLGGITIKTPEERAIAFLEYAQKSGNPELLKAASVMMERIAYGGGGGAVAQDINSKVNEMVTLFSAMASAMNSVATIGRPAQAAAGPVSPELAMMQFEHTQARERMADVRAIVPEVIKGVKDVVAFGAEKFKGPQVGQDSIKAAAEKAVAARGTSGPAIGAVPQQQSPPPSPPSQMRENSPPPQVAMSQEVMDKSVVKCGGCGKDLPIGQFISHAKDGCPPPSPQNAPASPAPQQKPQVSQMPTDDDVQAFKEYVKQMKSITGYIVAWNDGSGDSGSSPDSIANGVWIASALSKDARIGLLKAVDAGYDRIVQRSMPFIERLIVAYPSGLEAKEIQALYEALMLGGFVQGIPQSLDSIAPAVKELQDHIAIQTGPQGRRWVCAFLNVIASKAGKPLPHPELIKTPPGRQTL